MTPTLAKSFIILTAITLSAATPPSLPSLTESFQHLLTHPESPKNEYLKLISSIDTYASEKSSTLSNEEKKVLNLLSAAAVSKLLSKLSKSSSHPTSNEDQSEIRSKIDSLEHNTVTLPEFIYTENSRLESELATKLNDGTTTTDLFSKLSTLNSSISTPPPNATLDTVLLSQSQYFTLDLVQIYLCAITPLQRFRDIQQRTQVSNALLFPPSQNSTSPPTTALKLAPNCLQSVISLYYRLHFSTFLTMVFQTRPTEEGKTLLASNTELNRNIIAAELITHEKLRSFITAASQAESSLNALLSDLSTHVSQEPHNLRHLVSLYEALNKLDDYYPTEEDGPLPAPNTESIVKDLRSIRARLYTAIKSSIGQSPEDEGDFDEHLIMRDLLAGMASANAATCLASGNDQINSKEFETQVAQLIYYKHVNQLSNILKNLDSPEASAVDVQDSNLKLLSILAEQVIRSNLLQIEYDNLKKEQSHPSPNHSTRIKSYTFTLTESSSCAPDNFLQTCYLINGQYPGPPITVDQHDLLRVTVINKLTVPTAMHFHGILQKHTMSSDGVAHVTQDPIQPNSTYVYEMHIGEQSGTFMYHGHVGLDLVWLHGPLIVSENPEEWKSLGAAYAYDYEHTFVLEEVFHKPLDELIRGIVEEGIDDPPVTSFAINGKSYGNWSTNQGNATGYEVVPVKPGKVYRFRIINMGAGSMMVFTIGYHNLTVIEMDGVITEPVETEWLEVHTGQRYSVLVKMDQDAANFWVQSRLMGEEGGADNGRAILHYDCVEDPGEMRTEVFPGPSDPVAIVGDDWILDQLMPKEGYRQKGVYDFPPESDRQILIDMQMRTADGPPRFLVNGQSFQKPNRTYLESVRDGVNISADTHVFEIREGEVIDLVFQNRVDDTGGCDEHPMHLHGHSFWEVTRGPDEVDMSTIKTQLSRESGNRRQFRDTYTLFPNSTVESEKVGAPCGWAAVRFVADNPGLWLVHCHVTSHMILGKMFVLYEYSERNLQLINE